LDGLKTCVESITNDLAHYETNRYLPEFDTAKEMLSDYAAAIGKLRLAITRKSADELEAALAAMAYGNYYMGGVDLVKRGVELLLELSRNPKKKLLSPIVKALRDDDAAKVNAALDECKRAGWSHPAVQTGILSKILAARKRIQEVGGQAPT
jgi:hypothetical protein